MDFTAAISAIWTAAFLLWNTENSMAFLEGGETILPTETVMA